MRLAHLLLTAVLATSLVGLGGCGNADTASAPAAAAGGSWWTVVLGQVRNATGGTLEAIHDGSGWLLGKNEVKIEQIGDFETIDGVKYASYQVTVSRSDESFSAVIEDIQCDELGIPTEQSQQKMDEAVSKIKSMLDRLQS